MEALQEELKSVYGGVWCAYNGNPCSNCANKIWIDGENCDVLVNSIQLEQKTFDYGSLAMSLAGGWSALVISSGATYMFGLGTLPPAVLG